MKKEDFKKRFRDTPLITTQLLQLDYLGSYISNQISQWTKQGDLLQLKRGIYMLSDKYERDEVPPMFIANQLYLPSYVSMESALQYYGMIPEAVHAYNSVSTKKTAEFQNTIGLFTYQSIKNDLFFGMRMIKQQGYTIYIASPEKALLDLFYLRTDLTSAHDPVVHLRLQNLGILDTNTLLEGAKRMNNKRVEHLVLSLISSCGIHA